MQSTIKKLQSTIELMCPAGSWESLMAAIHAGADSVYFGVEQLNMRARDNFNFSQEDLKKISKVCKDHHVKTYLAINTILYDHDIPLMRSIAGKAKAAGIDAIIACDQAAMNYAKKIGMPVHVSTQANVSNLEAVEFYAPFADTIVLARELTLKQIANIVKLIRRKKIRGASGELLKIEIFAHGALCMAISGKCYLSLHSHNASANRGVCIQNCRRDYILTDKQEGMELEIDNEYVMSSKDLCTIGFLDKIMGTGVSVLKIEGRSRPADYVFTVTKCYREAIDAIRGGTYSYEKIADWKSRLATVFNRGFWEGYYLGKKMGEWNNEYGSKATQKKVYIGKGLKYFDKIKVGEFKIEAQSLSKGDEILVMGPTTGVMHAEVREMRVDDKLVASARKGEIVSMPLSGRIRHADKLYKVTDVE